MSKPRAIFEEVAAQGPASAPATRPGEADRRKRRARRIVGWWLIALAILVALMVLVGGMTRLTESGLSMVSWHPVLGAIPPLSDADWASEFEKYKLTAQYREINAWMGVEDFKTIYWWEWGHRQFGRVIGLVWGAGLAAFLALRMVPPGRLWSLVLPGLLGGAQAVIGMWMVESGVAEGSELVSVAPYRLALHLGLAFAILCLLLWPAWRLMRDEAALLQARRRRAGPAMAAAGVVLGLAFAQIVLGALVAGNDAGRGYVDWPLMNGMWFPAEALELSPVWTNFIWNDALTQFNHRVLGYALALASLAALALAWRSRLGAVRLWAGIAALAVWAQMGWGIVTVMNGAATGHAILHQAGALAMTALLLRARFVAAYPPEQSAIRG
ncbi:MAG: COX15/CtaA family protein [Rubrimonas sp.]|uniref:COX15/CtaA family protein n=1 Tax=Rubrimonas sp. TaxID=2036015 RepID=UPI002FDE804C